jgi:hypothetical protein
MDDLPDELVLRIISSLGAVDAIALGLVSRRFAALCSTKRVAFAVGDRRLEAGVERWIVTHGARIDAISAYRCTFGPGSLRWAENLHLRAFQILYGRVVPSELDRISPCSLETLLVHQLEWDDFVRRPFMFQHFTRLRRLDVTYTSTSMAVEVGGLDALVDLEILAMRNASCIEFVSPFPESLKRIHIEAQRAVLAYHALPASVEHATLGAGAAVTVDVLFGLCQYPAMRDLSVVSHVGIQLPCISKMPGLERLVHRTNTFIFGSEFSDLHRLRHVEIHVDRRMVSEITDEKTAFQLAGVDVLCGSQGGKKANVRNFILDTLIASEV